MKTNGICVCPSHEIVKNILFEMGCFELCEVSSIQIGISGNEEIHSMMFDHSNKDNR